MCLPLFIVFEYTLSNVYSKCSCFKMQSRTVRLDNWALPPRRSMFLSRIYFRTFTPLTSVKNKLLLQVTKTSCSYINFMTELVILSAIALFKPAKDAHGDSSRIFNPIPSPIQKAILRLTLADARTSQRGNASNKTYVNFL